MRLLTWAYKFAREIARHMPHFRLEPPCSLRVSSVFHPAFAPGGPASYAEGPIPFDAPRIVYSEEDVRALENFTRAKGV